MNGEQMRIVLAVEEALLGELIAFRLELLGHQVDIRNSADQLLQSLRATQYSLAIVDTALQHGDICETMRGVRTICPREQLPVLIISVDQSLALVEQAVRYGADDYLLAPFDPQIFQSKLDKLLQPRPAARASFLRSKAHTRAAEHA